MEHLLEALCPEQGDELNREKGIHEHWAHFRLFHRRNENASPAIALSLPKSLLQKEVCFTGSEVVVPHFCSKNAAIQA